MFPAQMLHIGITSRSLFKESALPEQQSLYGRERITVLAQEMEREGDSQTFHRL